MNKIEKCSVSQKGRIVIHKELIEKRIYPEDLDTYLADGWIIGVSDKHRNSQSSIHKGKVPWNKATKGVMKPNKTTWKKGMIPWNKGMKGMYESPKKGQTKETNASILKQSASQKENWANNPERKKAQAERIRAYNQRGKTPEELEHWLDACWETRMKNKTFNTSKPEEDYYIYLCDLYGKDNIFRNYRDKQRYPYRCDFYIKSQDLFIELNLHWTHGFKPYDPDDKDCQALLKVWQEKAKTSKYFAAAIETWTIRDVKKAKIAKENKLNYIIIYKL